ncbi:MAG: hypothetical protein EAX96_17390 [Candidatus Lokiarchaeota archaeon]|nr:hypothetical protein [Candidatus Lokiarchaeota archaeon]
MAEFKGIYLHRLLTLFLIIIAPIYFFILLNYVWIRTPFIIPFFEYYLPGSSEIIIKWVMPITFTVPWWIFLILYRNKFANSFVEMKERFVIIPKRWIVFYGVNGLLVISLLFIPFITPTLLIITVGLLTHDIYLLTLSEREGRGKYFGFIIILILLEIFPIIFQLSFIDRYIFFWNEIFAIWMLFIPYLFKITILMADALEFGGIIWLIYAGAIEFERDSGLTVTTEVPETRIKIFQFILFIIFGSIWIISLLFPIYPFLSEILFFIDVSALTVGVIILFISIKRGISREVSTSPFIGYVFMLGFLVLEVVQTIPYLFGLEAMQNLWLMSLVVFGAGVMFLIMWFISLLIAEDDDY